MKQAPKLKFNKKKSGGNCYLLPQKDIDKVFSLIDGKNGNAIKLMIVLLGTKEGFAPSTKWICDRTGMKKTAYYRARDYLVEQNLLKIINGELIITL